MLYNSKLSFEQRRALLALANQIINADVIRVREEEEYFTNLRRTLHLDEDVPFLEGKRQDLLKLFQDRKSRVTLLLELISIGIVDGLFEPTEHMLIDEIASSLSFSKSDLSKLIGLAMNHKKCLDEIESFIKG